MNRLKDNKFQKLINIPKFIINIKQNKKRLQSTLHELQKILFDDFYTIINAITPKDIQNPEEYIDYKTYMNILNPTQSIMLPTFGSLACALSHMKVWKHIVQNNIKEAFIIEDDIMITNKVKFKFDLQMMYQFIHNTDSKLFFTFGSKHFKKLYSRYYRYDEPFTIQQQNDSKEPITQISGPIIGTHFYYVNKDACLYFLNHIQKIKYQIDIEIGLLSHRLNMYNLNTSAIQQNKTFKSNVQLPLLSLEEVHDLFKSRLKSKYITRMIFSYIPYLFRQLDKDKRHDNIPPTVTFNQFNYYYNYYSYYQ